MKVHREAVGHDGARVRRGAKGGLAEVSAPNLDYTDEPISNRKDLKRVERVIKSIRGQLASSNLPEDQRTTLRDTLKRIRQDLAAALAPKQQGTPDAPFSLDDAIRLVVPLIGNACDPIPALKNRGPSFDIEKAEWKDDVHRAVTNAIRTAQEEVYREFVRAGSPAGGRDGAIGRATRVGESVEWDLERLKGGKYLKAFEYRYLKELTGSAPTDFDW